MPYVQRDQTALYYEESGPADGYPVLLFAPGGTDSQIAYWRRSPFDPTVALADRFRVIAMDQRNAGRSFAPVEPAGWDAHAADHLAVLDQLGIERAHLLGGCIGSSYCLRLIQQAPERVSAAVLQNPIGLAETNGVLFRARWEEAAQFAEAYGMAAIGEEATVSTRFADRPSVGPWAARILDDQAFAQQFVALDPKTYAAVVREYGRRMYGGEFVFSVDQAFVQGCQTPLLILAGADEFHPTATSIQLATLAPNADLRLRWREPDVIAHTVQRVRDFLTSATPA